MDISKYTSKNQQIVNYWKDRFNCLFYWDISFVYDGERWAQTLYDIKKQVAIIYPCEIEDEQSYLLHEIIKLCFIAVNNDIHKKQELITDLTTVILRDTNV